jgi:hypothetical protein
MEKKITLEDVEKAKQTIIAYENQEFTEMHGDGFPCICCDKKIKAHHPEHIRQPESGSYHDGIVDKIAAGYGSKFDTEIFIIGICDDCMEKLKDGNKIKYAGNYMNLL